MKKFTIQAVLLLLVIGIGIYLYGPSGNSSPQLPFLPQPTKLQDLQINDTTFKVEIADTQQKRSKGLGGRQSLAEFGGMLFIFDKTDRHAFWMKGLTFPLDFVWIKDDTVVDIHENIPPPTKDQPDSSLPIYSPKEEANKVLELNAGSIQKFNIKVGDKILIKE